MDEEQKKQRVGGGLTAITKISYISQTGKRYMAMHLTNAISYITDEENTQKGALVGGSTTAMQIPRCRRYLQ